MRKPSLCFVTAILVLCQLMDRTMADEGNCGNKEKYPGVTTLDLKRYMGCWYYYGIAFINLEEVTRPDRLECKTVQFEINTSKKNTLESIFKGIQGNEIKTIRGQATMATTGFPGNFDVKDIEGRTVGHYNIIDTDYDNYAIAYHCTPNGREMIYLMGRTRQPSIEVDKKIEDALSRNRVNPVEFILDDQKNCKASFGDNFCP